MTNFIQGGEAITVAAPAGGAVSGALVIIGSLTGVAATTQAAGEDVALATAGVFELGKVSTDAVAVGDKLYWDSGQAKLTKTPGTGSKPLVGLAVKAAGSGAATVYCLLTLTGQTGPA